MANSKIIFGGEVLIDLTSDTVEAGKLLKGITAHGKDGEPVVGTCTFDADTKDANVMPAEMLAGKTGYKNGQKITGTMPNNGAVSGSINSKDGTYSVPQGYHDGSGSVGIDPTEKMKLIPDNIREGVTILGVEGTMSGTEDAKPQQKTVTPKKEQQTVLPDEGYNYLSQVIVEGIPYSESENPAGGKTVTIG